MAYTANQFPLLISDHWQNQLVIGESVREFPVGRCQLVSIALPEFPEPICMPGELQSARTVLYALKYA